MKKIFLLLFGLLISNYAFSQLEIGAGFTAVAASEYDDWYDEYTAAYATGLQIDLDYDIMSESIIRVAPGLNTVVLYSDGIIFDVMPGVKVGLDYINAKVNYSFFDNLLWYGLGSRIPIGDHGINISLQGASYKSVFLVWASVGYSRVF